MSCLIVMIFLVWKCLEFISFFKFKHDIQSLTALMQSLRAARAAKTLHVCLKMLTPIYSLTITFFSIVFDLQIYCKRKFDVLFLLLHETIIWNKQFLSRYLPQHCFPHQPSQLGTFMPYMDKSSLESSIAIFCSIVFQIWLIITTLVFCNQSNQRSFHALHRLAHKKGAAVMEKNIHGNWISSAYYAYFLSWNIGCNIFAHQYGTNQLQHVWQYAHYFCQQRLKYLNYYIPGNMRWIFVAIYVQ